ncbi:MAG TPA: hypothetical protein PKZ21_04580 [Bacteroidales bacterium]|nr:hypothetical protein [Bacteroidales bacterium]
MVWNAWVEYILYQLYASSATNYGMGEHGFADRASKKKTPCTF